MIPAPGRAVQPSCLRGDSTTGNLPGDILAAQLDRLAAEQAGGGGWPSPYAEHWRGPSTVQSLLVLRAFGRL
jgi:hypothetical protein